MMMETMMMLSKTIMSLKTTTSVMMTVMMMTMVVMMMMTMMKIGITAQVFPYRSSPAVIRYSPDHQNVLTGIMMNRGGAKIAYSTPFEVVS